MQSSQNLPRNQGPPLPPFNTVTFRHVMVLGTASSALNMVVSTALYVANSVFSWLFPELEWALVL